MKLRNSNSEDGPTAENKHSHSGHMWMMIVCCGLPIVAFLAVAAFGINAPTLETLLLLICPIAMVVMVFSMMRGQHAERKQHGCCQSGQTTSRRTDERQDQSASAESEAERPSQMPEPNRNEHAEMFKA